MSEMAVNLHIPMISPEISFHINAITWANRLSQATRYCHDSCFNRCIFPLLRTNFQISKFTYYLVTSQAAYARVQTRNWKSSAKWYKNHLLLPVEHVAILPRQSAPVASRYVKINQCPHVEIQDVTYKKGIISLLMFPQEIYTYRIDTRKYYKENVLC